MSSDEDDHFFRLQAKTIAEALQERDAADRAVASGTGTASKSERERMIHDTYIALCHDDPRIESDLACQYLATALLDPKSPYALSGPLVEGIRQLCSKYEENTDAAKNKGTIGTNASEGIETNTNLSLTLSATPRGSALLAWAVYARIPLLCCQAKALSDVHPYLGSYRPPPPPTPLSAQRHKEEMEDRIKEQDERADHLAAILSQPETSEPPITTVEERKDDQNDMLGDEVWAAESDPSDFEFESGSSCEQQMSDLQNSFAEWMIDRSDPLKLSKPADGVTWKHVRHAVMDLTSQLWYRKISPLWAASGGSSTLTGSRTPADLLTQFTLTLFVPPESSAVSNRPSLYDSPDDAEDALQPQRQLQNMAWHPLWVLRDAAAAMQSESIFSEYLSLLRTLISVDSQAGNTQQKSGMDMAPATYVGLECLSALCQQFVLDADHQHASKSSQKLGRYRQLRLTIFETTDDLCHAMEREEKLKKVLSCNKPDSAATSDLGFDWVVWTLLPLWEILANQRLETGVAIVPRAESAAQKYLQQSSSQQWSALLQSGLFRQWLMCLQSVLPSENPAKIRNMHNSKRKLQWQLMRRSILYLIAHSMASTQALGKYAWRFPNFVDLAQIGESFSRNLQSYRPSDHCPETFPDECVDDIFWNLLSIELASNAGAAAPTIQWKSTNKSATAAAAKSLPTQEECKDVCWSNFKYLCCQVIHVLELACQEENRKENTEAANSQTATEMMSKNERHMQHPSGEEQRLILRSFHRFVNTLVDCPLLAEVFVNQLIFSSTSENTGTVTKCLDSIQEKLSQYKAPSPGAPETSKQKVDKDENGMDDVIEKHAKQQSDSASLQEDIHILRKVLKMLRPLLSAKTTSDSSPTTGMAQNIASSSKTD